jgi:hypothetical protein
MNKIAILKILFSFLFDEKNKIANIIKIIKLLEKFIAQTISTSFAKYSTPVYIE